jgi:decaprenylphospho-beta-D-ribofuranose 2-oxidase
VTARHPRGLVARGLGRSYGDAAQNAGGAVIDMTELKGITDFDEQAGRIRALAGTSLAEIIPAALARGWFLPVSPGTRHVTVGGAIASDIHGKNHHVEGTFGSHVTSLSLACPSKGRIELAPDDKPAPFWATVGGMGLTGVILEAEFDLIPAASSELLVDTDRAEDLDSLMALLAAEAGHRYSVAWVDCLATGRHLGRGVSLRGDHAPEPAAS